MIKTIDELMFINDGHIPFSYLFVGKGGLGFEPTENNIKGSGFLSDVHHEILELENIPNKTKNQKKKLSELFRIKYGTMKRMKGGGLSVKDTLNYINGLREELKKKNLNKGFWCIVDEGLKPLKDKEGNIITHLSKISSDIIKGNEDKYIGKKFAFINFGFNNDLIRKKSLEEITNSYDKYSDDIVIKLVITIEVVTDDGSIGKRGWICILNITFDDLRNNKFNFNITDTIDNSNRNDTKFFMKNTADKLVLSNNMVGIPYKGYMIALEKELKKTKTPDNRTENLSIKDTINYVNDLQEDLKKKNLFKGFWCVVDEGLKPLKDKEGNIIKSIDKIRSDILKDNEDKYIGKKIAFINFGFDMDFLKLPIKEIEKNPNHLVCSLTISVEVITDDGSIGKRGWICIINFTFDDFKNNKLKYSDAEYFMKNTADKLVLSNNMVGIPYKGYMIALEKELKKTKTPDNRTEKPDKKISKIENGYVLVNKNKIILYDTSNKIDGLKKQIKEKITPPKKNIKVFIVSITKSETSNNPLSIKCYRSTITPDLKLILGDDDELYTQTITWNKKEFEEYGLKKTDIYKIINAIKKNLISLEKDYVSISEVLKNQNKSNEKNNLKKDEYTEDMMSKKTYKNKKEIEKDIGTIMKGKSDLVKKNNKYSVDTELDIKEGLQPKIKRALKKSVVKELDTKIKGRSINLDYDSSSSSESDDEPKGKIDTSELKNYAKMLSHLLEHIEDPKEPMDKKDYTDAKRIIGDMEKVKRGRGRPKKC